MSVALHQLARALTPSEKRYLTIQLGQIKGNGDLQIALLKFIGSLPVYDLEAIRQHFSDYTPSQLGPQLTQLYKYTLAALRRFREESDPAAKLNNLLFEAQMMFDKGLFDACNKHLIEIETLAEKHEHLHVCYQALLVKARLALRDEVRRPRATVLPIALQIQQCLAKLHVEQECAGMIHFLQVMAITRIHALSEEEKQAVLPFLDKYPDLPDTSLRGKISYCLVRAFWALTNDKTDAAVAWAQQAVSWWESNELVKATAEDEYFISLYILLNLSFRGNRSDLYAEYLPKAKALPDREGAQTGHRLQFLAMLQMQHWLMTDTYCEVFETDFAQLVSDLEKYDRWLSNLRRPAIYHNVATIYFLNLKWEEARMWYAKVIQNQAADVRVDLQRAARIMEVFCWLEAGAWEMVQSRLHAADEFFRHANKSKGEVGEIQQETEQLMLKHLRKVQVASNVPDSSLQEVLAEFLAEMTALHDRYAHQTTILMGEPMYWLRYRLFGDGTAEGPPPNNR